MSHCAMHVCLQPPPPYVGHGSAAVAWFSSFFSLPPSQFQEILFGSGPLLVGDEGNVERSSICPDSRLPSPFTVIQQHIACAVWGWPGRSLPHQDFCSFLFPAVAWPIAKSKIVKVQTGSNIPYFMDSKMPLPSHFLSHLQRQELSYNWY